MNLIDSYCPACGCHLDFLPWENDSPSCKICPCCGIQFGYDDYEGNTISECLEIYKEWCRQWINKGMCWNSVNIPPTDHWDLEKQLKNVFKEI